jgi:DNA-binding transcriptional ArsR family regulator
MRSSSSPSPDEHEALLQRFVIASRRGEIVALINSARTEADLGSVVASELCEAYEAEIGFVLVSRAGSQAAEMVGHVGLTGDDPEMILSEPLCAQVLAGSGALAERGTNLLGLGIQDAALAPGTAGSSRLLVGVGRLSAQPFTEIELGLLEAITRSTAHALERFGLERQLERAQDIVPSDATSPLLPDLDSLADFFRRLGHPIRLRILLALGGDTLSPSELEERLGVGLGVVAYHVRNLREDGLVMLVDTRATRGSLESFYRLTARGELARHVLATTGRQIQDIPDFH